MTHPAVTPVAVTPGRAVPSTEYRQERTANGNHHPIATWREATVFTEAERAALELAALELAEQGARFADAADGVSDETWANAGDQLAALAALIALTNTYNRLNVITRQPAGGYQPVLALGGGTCDHGSRWVTARGGRGQCRLSASASASASRRQA